MRTDEQRDHCIDLLLTRVKTLEHEVARLKGKPLSEEDAVALRETELPGMALPRKPATIDPDSEPQDTELPDFDFEIPAVSQVRQKIGAGGPSRPSDSSLENAIGTRWIGRIGVLAILIGIAFFLKYSFDNKLIGETGRVMLGIFWGAAFIGAGEYLQKKKNMALYGQMLSGGGLAVLYLALYAAFALYHLIPAPLATAGMLAVTSTGMTLSVRYSAYSLAAIALLGGFLTPIMLSTGENQPLTLFSYVLLLDAGTVLLLRFRRWPSLVAASLVGTVLLYSGWHAEFFDDGQRWSAFGIVALFFAFYNIFTVASRLYAESEESRFDQILIFGSAGFFFLAFFSQQQWESHWPVKSFSLALAACEILLAGLVSRRSPKARLTVAAYAAVSVIMTVIATCVALEKRWILPALAAEMAALAWIGLRLNLPVLRRGAYLLGLLVLYRFADDIHLDLEPFERFVPIINGRFLVCATAIAAFYVLMISIARYRDKLHRNEPYALEISFILTQILSLALLSIEVEDFFQFRSTTHTVIWGPSHYAFEVSLSVLWALYASLLTGVGIIKRLRGARILGILLLGGTVLKVFLIDLSSLQTFYRIISFIVLGLLLLAVSYGYNHFKHVIFGEDQP